MKRIAAFAGLLLVLTLLPARAQQTPDDQYIFIYSRIEQADSLQAAGQPAQALAQYTQAREDLEKFTKTYPDWDPVIVKFRLGYLADKISALTPQVSPPAPAPNPPPQAVTTTGASTKAAANPAPAPNADLTAQMNALQTQLQNLRAANETLQAKLKEALSLQPPAADTQDLARAQAQVLSLMKQNDLLRASQGAGPTNGVAPGDLASLRADLAEAGKKLADQTARADKLAQDNQALQTRLQTFLAGGDAMQALRDENDRLKRRVAELEAALANTAGTSGKDAELAAARAKIAALQSDADINWLEKAALEGRLRQLQSAPLAAAPPAPMPPPPAPSVSSDELQTLRARVAVDEAQAVPYTPQELALLRTSGPASRPRPVSELPGGSTELVAEAQGYFSDRQFDKAEADYQKILTNDSNNALALANLAAIELAENKLDDARQHIQAALTQSPNDSYDLLVLGEIQFSRQQYDDALNALSRAAMLDPQNPEVQNYLGVTLAQKGLRGQAETALRRAIQLDPAYGAAHNNLTVIYLTEQPPLVELARWHYQKALENGQARNPDLEKMLAGKGAPVGQ